MRRSEIDSTARRWCAVAIIVGLLSVHAAAQHYVRTDLTTDISGVSPTATKTDPNLVNAWGLSRGSSTPWWVSDNGTGVSTLYDGTGTAQSLVVRIPAPSSAPPGTSATPTGTAWNSLAPAFALPVGGPALFLFVTEDGTIAGWNSSQPADPTDGSRRLAATVVDNSGRAIYKGIALAQSADGPRLYATDFVNHRVDVFDASFHPVHTREWAFKIPGRAEHYAPFGIQNVGGNIVVTFARVPAGSTDEDHGPGLGFVGVFSPEGRLLLKLEHGPWMNAPWGIALAPGDFGAFAHRLLIGNFGDGTIQAFNAVTGEHVGMMLDQVNNPIQVDGLWALGFGNNGRAGSATTLYFTAGPDDESHGLLGMVTPVNAEQRGNAE